jgi:ABC-type multidrug transport system permease subunit
MKTAAYSSLQTNGPAQLIMAFPFFLVCVYLLPLYYTVTRLAEERESKTREAMKMMGLRDHSYYLAWFIVLALLVALMSALVVGTLSLQTL